MGTDSITPRNSTRHHRPRRAPGASCTLTHNTLHSRSPQGKTELRDSTRRTKIRLGTRAFASVLSQRPREGPQEAARARKGDLTPNLFYAFCTF